MTIARSKLTGSMIKNGTINTSSLNNDAPYALINVPPNIQTGDYTLRASDNGSVVYMNSGSTQTLTIPTALVAGFNCSVIQAGAGQVTFVGSGGMTINEPDSKTKISKQYASITVYIEATNNCIIGGYTA